MVGDKGIVTPAKIYSTIGETWSDNGEREKLSLSLTLRFSTSSRRCGLLAVIIYDMAMAVTNRVCKHCKEAELDKNGTTSLFSVRCNKTELHIFLTLSRDPQCLSSRPCLPSREYPRPGRKPGEMQS